MAGSTTEYRVIIEAVRPTVECGRFAAKAAAGQPLEVSADIFADGHDKLMAVVRHGPPPRGRAAPKRTEVALEPVGNDHWRGLIVPKAVGPWEFEVVGLPDVYGSWARDLRLRIEAGQDVTVELEDGAQIVDRQGSGDGLRAADRKALEGLAAALRSDASVSARLAAAAAPEALELMRRTADRSRATVAGPYRLFVDRPLATFSAWYEMFPRSEGAVPPRGGTFASAAQRLPAIADMGFDIVYLPPIHPIGTTFRKGPNNTLECLPGDVGSPWAIGSEEGGHTAVHPDLGSIADFDAFVERARGCGLEVALDFAVQCSPDHPWVREHPQWFRHRSDGTIRYAENPPKRYQDIYPVNFDTDDRDALFVALRDVMLYWIDHGVSVLRVDNPHTKHLTFWEWVIPELRARNPEVILLSEAFTRPRVMERLAKVGFTQSYTYFTWRNSKQELTEYLTELSQTEKVDWFRPNFWVNTPDILHEVLQHGGPPAFRLRMVLAALSCPSWGMYAGYELFENTPVRSGSEEYLDAEKYQLRPRDWARAGSLAPLISRVNRIRRRHCGAVSQLRTLRLHHVSNDALLCFSRSDDARSDVLLVVVNLDPVNVREGTTWIDLGALGVPDDRPFEAHDELTDTTYIWHGAANYVRLDPAAGQAAHVLHLRPR
ncbi:MAG: alpha-1,4-glucan--maltose-1-phosphate maltosyltransferase [Chloroflexi bacterium]|nr:MAG: alpha-1,4-glucan--maltose-1-phosphate maltosyltransferase [Chloroflexota bacterium]